MIIRRYRESDTRQITTLFYETIHEVNIRDYTQEQVDTWAPCEMDFARWVESLKRKMTFVADKDGLIVGFGELEDSGHIDRFYCHKAYQGVGVGTKLLAAIEAEAKQRGITRLFAEVSITARPFFEKRGFKVSAEQVVTVRNVDFINYRMERTGESEVVGE